MLEERDRKWLEGAAGRSGAALEKLLWAVAAFMAIAGGINLALAHSIGAMEHYSLRELLTGWVAGIRLDRHYSGSYVKALERLCVAASQWGVVAVVMLHIATGRSLRQRYQRILAALGTDPGHRE